MREKLKRRIFPLVASIGLLLVGMFTTTLGPTWTGKAEWALPYDLWGTLIATVRLVHGNVGGLYTQPTGLVSLPGAAIILLPCAAVIAAAGLSLQIPGPHNLHPPVWLLAGPYEIALCCVTLFAADALAEQLGVTKWKRGLLAVASAVALWNVSARWGHPEDAVAVGLLLYAVLALGRSRTALAGWLGRRRGLRPAAGAARAADAARAPAVAANAGVPRQVGPAVRGAARRGGAGQLARHVHLGDQPAELPGDQPPHRVDVAGPAHVKHERHGRPRAARHDRARLLLRARGPPPLARPGRDGRGRRRGRRHCWPTCSGGRRSRWRCGRSSSR